MHSFDMPFLLVNPPLTDPTAPYHSISYLVGAASSAGYTGAVCADANIDCLNTVARSKYVGALRARCSNIRTALEHKPHLTRREQFLYRTALLGLGFRDDAVENAISVLRSPDTFYDYRRYRDATMVIRRWLNMLSVDGYPGQFDGFNLSTGSIVNYSNIEDLADASVIETLVRPFEPYFTGPFKDLLLRSDWPLIGISLNYLSQLPFVVWMCRLVKQHRPGSLLCLGGTEVTAEVKGLRTPVDVYRIFPDCDAIVVGEGESAFLEILNACKSGQPLPRNRPGLLAKGHRSITRPTPRYEDLRTLPPPRYDVWNWADYWSPEPIIYYSPTRGCYWNKCTFCDYGLNSDAPTSPSRDRPIQRALEDLAHITEIGKTLYLAVDAISPSYLRKLCEAVIAHDIDIRWSAEVRLEKSLLGELPLKMRRAGCVSLSFGYESASQRVLDLIDKGVDISMVPSIMQRLRDTGIGVQMMGFIGFPSETSDEAKETYQFLCRHEDAWALSAIGDFALTPGSIVAQRPDVFGIESLITCDGDDIVRVLLWADAQGTVHAPGDARNAEIAALCERVRRSSDDRPFVGGVDSNHTILYFAKYGPSLTPPNDDRTDARSRLAATLTYETPWRVQEFCGPDDLDRFHRAMRLERRSPRAKDVIAWLDEPVHIWPCSAPEVFEVLPSGTLLPMERDELEAGESYRAVKRLLLEARGLM